MSEICYLCGNQISGKVSNDHVYPKTMMNRKQPKMKGYEYAGTLPTHPECNNRFGDEKMCKKALRVLEYLNDPGKILINSALESIAIDSTYFPDFNKKDREFFGWIDARKSSIDEINDPSFYQDKQKVNPIKKSINTSLSVIAKSSAAYLISKYNVSLPKYWKILFVTYYGEIPDLELDKKFGKSKPFDDGVNNWVVKFENGDYFIIFKCGKIITYCLFLMSNDMLYYEIMRRRFSQQDKVFYIDSNLMALNGYDWTNNLVYSPWERRAPARH